MARRPRIEANPLDRAIAWAAPEWALRRHRARMMLDLTGGYAGASRSRRALSEWRTPTGSADDALAFDRMTLVDRSHDLMRNAPLATGAVNTVTTGVVGTGLRAQPAVDREYLRRTVRASDDELDEFEQAVERWWTYWASSQDVDVRRHLNFNGIQELAFRSSLVGGDVFVRRRFVERGRALATALQVIEGDRVDTAPGSTGDDIFLGVRRDDDGAPVAYVVNNAAIGSAAFRPELTVEIPAFDAITGERLVHHLYAPVRPDQTRGVPYLAPVIESLKQLDRYSEAEIMAAVVSAMFTVFIESESDGMDPMEPKGETGGSAADKDFKMAPGAMLDLMPGEKASFANPMRPNQAFDGFVMSILRQVGVALELPFELLVKHFTASFSASQAAFIEAWRFYLKRRAWLRDLLCQPVYEAVITEAIGRGHIAAPGFFGDPLVRAAWLGCAWVGMPRPAIDPVKEVRAAELRIAAGISNRAREAAELLGGDWETIHAQAAKEHRRRVADGLEEAPAPQPHDPPPRDLPPQPPDDDDDDDEPDDIDQEARP